MPSPSAGRPCSQRRKREMFEPTPTSLTVAVVLTRATESGEAVQCAERAVALVQQLGDRAREAGVLGTLGTALVMSGNATRAAECHTRQLALARDLGDRSAESSALFALSMILGDAGNITGALEHARRALQIRHRIGDTRTRAIEQRISRWESEQR